MCCKNRLAQAGRLNQGGMADLNLGRPIAAKEKLLTALAQVRAVGSVCYEAKILNNLGLVYECQGNAAGADRNYRQAMTLVEEKVGKTNALYETICRNLDRMEAAMHCDSHEQPPRAA